MKTNEIAADSSETHLPTQPISEGFGALYHRVYSIVVESTWENAMRSMTRFKANLNHFSPQIMCRFEKKCGEPHELKPGDEFQIHITGPWNGPVRVKEVDDRSFTLQTLEGHMEAGEIQFRVHRLSSEQVRFEIESLARSKDMIVDFIYDKIPIAKFAQTEMWTLVCEAMGKELSWGRQGDPRGAIGEVVIVTERRDEETGEWQTL